MEEIRYTRGLKPSTATKQLRNNIPKEGNLCSICKKKFPKNRLVIEHTIPVCLGGLINNYTTMCIDCHKEKDITDKAIIAFFKKVKLLIRIGPNWYGCIGEIKELTRTYELLYDLIRQNVTNMTMVPTRFPMGEAI